MTTFTPSYLHPQREASRLGPDGKPITVDEELHTLIEALWAAGIDTQFSCQGGGDVPNVSAFFSRTARDAYILFPSMELAHRFLVETLCRLGVDRHDDDTGRSTGRAPETLFWGTSMVLHGYIPLPDDPTETLRGSVAWPATLTPIITRAWTDHG